MGTRTKARTKVSRRSTTAVAYPAKLTKDTGGRYLVTFKDFPECLTDGADESEALLEAKDALSEAIMGRLARGEDIPAATMPIPGERQIAPYPDAAMKLAVARAVDTAGWSVSKLARQMGVDEKEARRILDPAHRTKIGRLYEAMAATGHDVVVSTRRFEDAEAVMAKALALSAKRTKGTVAKKIATKRKPAKKQYPAAVA